MSSSCVVGRAAPEPLLWAMIAVGSNVSWSAPGAAALPLVVRPDSAKSAA